ncbi:hypothetical protein BN14_01474 [Rhizoctonia solani AG-1 IB]|uniref:Uncharacterized protein n=1 Tax=Thanatephorus cucumeris (strain AG1-IB / isolate 7/3/14) TaxID=1108050 RepID=M5BMI8_THACB|nr:hypothetical protein BN14_01474 [Rhizoctonia solani AG-1 IB]
MPLPTVTRTHLTPSNSTLTVNRAPTPPMHMVPHPTLALPHPNILVYLLPQILVPPEELKHSKWPVVNSNLTHYQVYLKLSPVNTRHLNPNLNCNPNPSPNWETHYQADTHFPPRLPRTHRHKHTHLPLLPSHPAAEIKTDLEIANGTKTGAETGIGIGIGTETRIGVEVEPNQDGIRPTGSSAETCPTSQSSTPKASQSQTLQATPILILIPIPTHRPIAKAYPPSADEKNPRRSTVYP